MNTHYFRFYIHFYLHTEGAAALQGQEPDHPWYQQFQEKLPSFDSVHNLIYQKLSAAELKGMKQTPGRKGKGSATRTTRSSKKGKKV